MDDKIIIKGQRAEVVLLEIQKNVVLQCCCSESSRNNCHTKRELMIIPDENHLTFCLAKLAIRNISNNPLNIHSGEGLSLYSLIDTDRQTYLNDKTVKVKCVYDNVILSLPLTNITFGSEVFDKNTVQIHHLDAFFFYVALVSTLLISRMGHFHRGGLAVGSHYESERDNYLFIFSEAHDKAVKLEREAEYPVALLDNSLRAFLEEMAYPHIDKFFYKDVKDRYCFDTYSCFEILEKGFTINSINSLL